MIRRIYNIYCFISRNFMWLIALIVGIVNVIKPFINQKAKVDTMNSKPEDRKEEPGEPDSNGIKQVETISTSTPKPNEVPVGVITETKTTITGEGTLKPIDPINEPGERSTEDILRDLSKALNRNND